MFQLYRTIINLYKEEQNYLYITALRRLPQLGNKKQQQKLVRDSLFTWFFIKFLFPILIWLTLAIIFFYSSTSNGFFVYFGTGNFLLVLGFLCFSMLFDLSEKNLNKGLNFYSLMLLAVLAILFSLLFKIISIKPDCNQNQSIWLNFILLIFYIIVLTRYKYRLLLVEITYLLH